MCSERTLESCALAATITDLSSEIISLVRTRPDAQRAGEFDQECGAPGSVRSFRQNQTRVVLSHLSRLQETKLFLREAVQRRLHQGVGYALQARRHLPWAVKDCLLTRVWLRNQQRRSRGVERSASS